MKKIYLAAPYETREQALGIAKRLKGEGFLITSRWLTSHLTDMDVLNGDPEAAREEAREDIVDLIAADALVVLHYGPFSRDSAGKHFELGFAFAGEQKIFLIGERSHVFHYLKRVKVFPTIEEFVASVREVPVEI